MFKYKKNYFLLFCILIFRLGHNAAYAEISPENFAVLYQDNANTFRKISILKTDVEYTLIGLMTKDYNRIFNKDTLFKSERKPASKATELIGLNSIEGLKSKIKEQKEDKTIKTIFDRSLTGPLSPLNQPFVYTPESITHPNEDKVVIDGKLLNPELASQKWLDAHVERKNEVTLSVGVVKALRQPILITSGIRPPTDSKAHANGGIDLLPALKFEDRMIQAQRISEYFADHGYPKQVRVILEEVFADITNDNGKLFQVNFTFEDGKLTVSREGYQGDHEQLHARSKGSNNPTHIHVQPILNKLEYRKEKDIWVNSKERKKEPNLKSASFSTLLDALRDEEERVFEIPIGPEHEDRIFTVVHFKSGEKVGQGEMITPSGNKLTGVFDENGNLQDGNAVFTFKDGSRYSGNFIHGIPSGLGVKTFWNNDKLEGHWLDGEHIDEKDATYTWADGSKFKGRLKNLLPNGHGERMYLSGEKLECDWIYGKVTNGNFTTTFPSGIKLSGHFNEGIVDGSGTYFYTNGDKQDLEFKNGRFMDGIRTYTYSNGNKFVGMFKNGTFNGHGILYFKNGNRVEGNWGNGKLLSDGHEKAFDNSGKDISMGSAGESDKEGEEKEGVPYVAIGCPKNTPSDVCKDWIEHLSSGSDKDQ